MAKKKTPSSRKPGSKNRSDPAAAGERRSVLIACGGTGGHLFPGIAVAEVLQTQGHQVRLLISEKKIDTLAASGHPDLQFEKLPFLAMPRPWSPKMVKFLTGLWNGRRSCLEMIRNGQVDTVLGMGGFTSFAPLWAGKSSGCRTLIHESNAIPGKANRLNARYSDTVLCGLEACVPHFAKHPRVLTIGTPVRSNLKTEPETDPYEFFKLDPQKKTLLVMGGSQGARGINQVVGMALEALEAMGIQILHITGPAGYEDIRNVYAKRPMLGQHVAAFCHRMDLAYRAADLVIARSGASSLAELSYFGLPSLLVPYPHAADDHQTLNAHVFSDQGAAKTLVESGLNAEVLIQEVAEILNGPHAEEVRSSMADAARRLSVADSAERIATEVLSRPSE